MKLDLPSLVRRPSRRPITLPNIATTKAQASDLLAIYLRVVAAWSDGKARVMAEYERTLAQMITDTAETTGSAIEQVADEVRRLVLMLSPDLRRWALRVEAVHRGRWIANILSATSVNLDTILTPGDMAETVQSAIEWNVALIRDVAEDTRRRVANAVFAGFQRRAPASEIAKEISEAVGMARSRARRIAADQTVKLGARLNQARQQQAGLDKFKWRHSGKRHPRPHHEERDGKVYPWSGEGSIRADDLPGVPPYCGCTAMGWISFDD